MYRSNVKLIMALMGDQMIAGAQRRQPAYVRFQNNTCYSVEVNWINFCNNEQPYCILDPNKFVDVNTFSTHTWVFRECMSKSRMVVAGREVFIATPWIEEHRRLEFKHPITVPLRTMVLIEMPAMDLRQLCLLKLAQLLKTKDDIIMLEIPKTLQEELIEMISNKGDSST
ncbi:protein Vhl isoform X2 [Melanaphis sacchari]|uniref:protein Vhl isoform X2 n=1 Tax=Melanaphis sacchari TaxID=742174 RepID=UPI000DC159FE|nr:protein Vhl isoform X2 [Melanaphis sacchari]